MKVILFFMNLHFDYEGVARVNQPTEGKKETFITSCTRYFLHIVVSWEIWPKRIYEK
jgi:hypothetical protein